MRLSLKFAFRQVLHEILDFLNIAMSNPNYSCYMSALFTVYEQKLSNTMLNMHIRLYFNVCIML